MLTFANVWLVEAMSASATECFEKSCPVLAE
jgi:hypothetical protein